MTSQQSTINHQQSTITVYCDGGARGNPGPAAWGFVVKKDGITINQNGGYIGIATNNAAEYTAVIKALTYLEEHNTGSELRIYVDSQLVASQLSGIFKVKNPAIREMVLKIRNLENSFANITYTHIPREQNKEADLQVNLALDKATTSQF